MQVVIVTTICLLIRMYVANLTNTLDFFKIGWQKIDNYYFKLCTTQQVAIQSECMFYLVPKAPANLQTCFGEKLANGLSEQWRINLKWNLPEGSGWNLPAGSGMYVRTYRHIHTYF